MSRDLELLKIDLRTLFLTTARGRIERENDPDRSPGPRLWLAGCAQGNVSVLRFDVADEMAEAVATLIGDEPPLTAPGAHPRHGFRYIDLIAPNDPTPSPCVIFELPHRIAGPEQIACISSESADGRHLLAAYAARGLPDTLRDLGFSDVSHLWAPWCLLLHQGRPASVAFAARLSRVGAEVGVVTVPEFRHRGFAARVTAAWTNIRSLERRALFYSTHVTNLSSRRVAERLGLRLVGTSIRYG